MQWSDEQLVDKFKSGSVEAFEELVNRYERKVYTLAYRFTGNYADAGDMVQEVFIRVYRALPKFRAESSFSTWIYKVAANVCRDELRKQRRKKSVSLENMEANQGEIAVTDEAQSPEEFVEQRDLQARVQKYIDQLTEDQRMILLLREMHQLSYEEMADVLECSLGTVKSRLSRARLALKNKMQAAGELS
ncbi:MAG: sigma-70 family RNA polymerase sigma factor [Firmicutes bacterium]|nr:sigma-70 family RNA polymerase sigma factor [Bacillota bacterium]